MALPLPDEGAARRTSPRRIGLGGRLLLVVFGSFAALLAMMAVIALESTRYSTGKQAAALAKTHVAYLRAAFLTLPHDARGLPDARSLLLLRQDLRALRPEMGFEVIAGGVTLDGGTATPLQQRAAAAIRAAPDRPFFEIEGPTGAKAFTYVEALNGDPSLLLEVHSALAGMRQKSDRMIFLAGMRAGVGAILVGLGLFFGIRRTTVRATRLARSVARLAASKDFSAPIEAAGGNDEISDLSTSVEELAGVLRSTLAALGESSGKLASAGQGLADNAAEQAALVERQVRSIREAITSAEEIKRSSETAAERAKEVLEAADRAGKLGEAGEAAVHGTLGVLGEIRGQVGEMGGRIGVLAEQAQQIAGITHSVKELADSSNMLALNAAIEAARSGEQGKGFALVAREVHNLADQSIRSTEQVREILNEIGASIRKVSAISSRGSRRIEVGLEQLARSGASLRELARATGESSRSARVIAAAVQEQNAGIVQIARALADRDQLARRTSEELERTRQSARVLLEVTSQVKGLLQGYRL